MGIFRKKQTPDVPRRRQGDSVGGSSAPSTSTQYMFQRGRTLTGTTSNQLQTANHPSDLQSPRVKAHHLALQRRKVASVLFVILIVIICLFWLLTQFTGKAVIAVSDTAVSQPVDQARYEKAINEYLGLNPVNRLRFALDTTALAAYMAHTLPEVSGVSHVEMGALGETVFTLDMRRAVAGWTINNNQYYVDESGTAFATNYYKNPSVQIVDNSGVKSETGTTVASNRFLGFVGRVVARAEAQGYAVTQAILPAGTTRQLDITLSGVHARIRLSIDRSAGEQTEDMARALRYMDSHGLSGAEYVDVRVSGKAVYK